MSPRCHATVLCRPQGSTRYHCWVAPESSSPGQCPNPGNCHIRGPSCWSAGSHHCWEEHVLLAHLSGRSRGTTFPVTARSKSGIAFRLTTQPFASCARSFSETVHPLPVPHPAPRAGGYHAVLVEHTTLPPPRHNSNLTHICYCNECLVCGASSHLPDLEGRRTRVLHLYEAHSSPLSSPPGFNHPPVLVLRQCAGLCSCGQHKAPSAAVFAQP